MRRGELDRLRIPDKPLDILAQQMVAACACEDWSEDALFALARSTYSYRTLERRDFDEIVALTLRNTLVMDRLEGTGRLTARTARDHGVLGYVARASGKGYQASQRVVVIR